MTTAAFLAHTCSARGSSTFLCARAWPSAAPSVAWRRLWRPILTLRSTSANISANVQILVLSNTECFHTDISKTQWFISTEARYHLQVGGTANFGWLLENERVIHFVEHSQSNGNLRSQSENASNDSNFIKIEHCCKRSRLLS